MTEPQDKLVTTPVTFSDVASYKMNDYYHPRGELIVTKYITNVLDGLTVVTGFGGVNHVKIHSAHTSAPSTRPHRTNF